MNKTTSLAPEVQQMLDRQAIYECEARICRAADRYDQEGFLAGFHLDATIDVGELCGSPAELWAWLINQNRKAGNPTTFHYILNHICDLDGDTAHAETYWLFVQRGSDGSNYSGGGRYADRLEKRNGMWKIVMRVNMIEWSGAIQGLPMPFDAPDLRANGGPSHSKDDPIYRRPLVNKRPKRVPVVAP